MTDYKPGQVATMELVAGRAGRFRGIRGVGGWYSDKYGFSWDQYVTDVRPLVVLDFTPSPAHLPQLLRLLRDNFWLDLADQIEAQTKPRVAEPQGLGAVVEGREGNRWVRTNESSGFPWRKVGSMDRVSAWALITSAYEPVAVLSEGVA